MRPRLKTRQLVLASAVAGLVFATAPVTRAQQAFPNAGQSQDQQSRDRFECHQWAVQQSGFDPTIAEPLAPAPQPTYAGTPPPLPPPPQARNSGGGTLLGLGNGGMFEGGGMLGDAATGAGLGAAGGALAGDAGKGAAIGALAGTLLGAMSRGGQQTQQTTAEQDYYYQQQQYQQQQQFQQQNQAQNDRSYMERRERQESYRRAFGACMASRNYTVQ